MRFPPAFLRSIVERFHYGSRQTRIFNQSINASAPCRLRHMSAWAAEIDLLSSQYDVLFIQRGNLQGIMPAAAHRRAGTLASRASYPDYFTEASCRVSNPAQSLQALTPGVHRLWRLRARRLRQPGNRGWPSFCFQPLPRPRHSGRHQARGCRVRRRFRGHRPAAACC